MKSQFGKTKEYLFGKLTDVRAGEIRVVRLFGKALFEKCGDTQRLFGFTSDTSDVLVTKLIATFILLLTAIPLFIFLLCAFLYAIWKPSQES